MSTVRLNPILLIKIVFITAVLIGLGWISFLIWSPPEKSDEIVDKSSLFNAAGKTPVKPGLPSEQSFKRVAENDNLELLVDQTTAHFQIISKQSGKVWRSYPDPQHWGNEKIANTWKNNLTSPIIIDYVNTKNYKSLPVTSGVIDNQGYLENFKLTDKGFTVTIALPKVQFKIPIEVSLKDDYVETKIVDSGIIEGSLSLINVKLYPLFGAQPSVGQDGYIFLPDGSGALIHFEQDRIMQQLTYNESVYGNDFSFFNEHTGRQRIAMPVFGLKSGDQAFVAIITQGEAFANVYAAPSGAVGGSNWVTAEWQYRKRFFQSVSKSTGDGFYTYSDHKLIANERATRYYPLNSGESNYVGMANVYREYLMNEQGVKPLSVTDQQVPLFIDIVGADMEKGLFADTYLKATTTEEAAELIQDIHDQGIENLRVNVLGWQQDGYSTQGGYFPVDSRIGGDEGMKKFISLAHSLDIPVYLGANYSLNSNGDDGFWWRRDGLRDLAGTVIEMTNADDQGTYYFVSPKFYQKVIASDLDDFKALGADGIYYEDGIGQQVNTDFNSHYKASRMDVVETQEQILKSSKEVLGSISANNSNFYALPQLDHVHRLTGDYSYDVFVSEEIPFVQIVLHGLRTYTLESSNLRDEWSDEFLKSIEYGAYPTYILSGEAAEDLKKSYSVWQYSLNYKDWMDQLTEEYSKVNKALAAVQDRFISAHYSLAPGVKVTEYGGDYQVLVNYNSTDFKKDGLVVPAKDFVVIKGGITQ